MLYSFDANIYLFLFQRPTTTCLVMTMRIALRQPWAAWKPNAPIWHARLATRTAKPALTAYATGIVREMNINSSASYLKLTPELYDTHQGLL